MQTYSIIDDKGPFFFFSEIDMFQGTLSAVSFTQKFRIMSEGAGIL